MRISDALLRYAPTLFSRRYSISFLRVRGKRGRWGGGREEREVGFIDTDILRHAGRTPLLRFLHHSTHILHFALPNRSRLRSLPARGPQYSLLGDIRACGS